MKIRARLFALIGLQAATPIAAGAEPPFEHQLWVAEHVVVAQHQGAPDHGAYRLLKLLKGDPASLRHDPRTGLMVNDQLWRQLGKKPENGQKVLLLLTPPATASKAASALELYLLGPHDDFVHAPDDSAVKRRLTLAKVEELLRRPPFTMEAYGKVRRVGDYVLGYEVLHAGTRSEGYIGHLYRYGQEIVGEREGQTLVADVEKGVHLIFRGSKRPHLWSVSGWDVQENNAR